MFVSTARDWGNIVRDRRAELEMSQAALAERIGKARQWVVRFESGHAGSASVDSLLRLLDALELEIQVDTVQESDGAGPVLLDIDGALPFDQ